jgi:signal transduction histidine kinase
VGRRARRVQRGGSRIRSDGASFWASVTITALRDDAGALLGFAKLSRDLAARRAADALRLAAAAAAEEARAAAEAASAAKSGFLATISHEIRTPINAILGYTELLALELAGPLTADQRRYLQSARASGQHLLALITQVLDFSHVDGARAGARVGGRCRGGRRRGGRRGGTRARGAGRGGARRGVADAVRDSPWR